MSWMMIRSPMTMAFQMMTAGDTGAGLTCEGAYDFMYNECDLAFFNENDQLIPLDDVITYCVEGDPFYGGDAFDCIIEFAC